MYFDNIYRVKNEIITLGWLEENLDRNKLRFALENKVGVTTMCLGCRLLQINKYQGMVCEKESILVEK